MGGAWQFATLVVTGFMFFAGCGNYVGATPEGGYDNTHVVYERKEPKRRADATILRVPVFDNSKYPDEPEALPEPRVWKKSMPIAFVGEVELFDDQTDSAFIRIEVSPILADGTLGPAKMNQMWANWIKGEERIAYRLDWSAPSKPGRYHVAIKSIGPALDIKNLDTFVEGDVEVR